MTIALTGSNSYMLRRRLNQLTSEFVAIHGELALERFDGVESEISKVLDAVQSLPFLASSKMVVVRDLGANKQAADYIDKLIDGANGSTELVLYEAKIDKRSIYYKTLKKRAQLEEFEELKGSQLGSWLVSEARSRGGEISSADAAYLVNRVGIDQMLLGSELDKLLAYGFKISRASIDLLTEPTPQSKIFDLLDAAFAGNKRRALEIYEEQRAQKVEPQQILAMLAWQLQTIALVSVAGSRSDQVIAREAGINPYVVGKTAGLARRIDDSRLKWMVSEALQIDYRSKTSALDIDEALRNYLITI